MPASLFPSDTAGYVRVAVERAVDRYPEGLTYAIPADLADLAVGERVIVPLGRGGAPTAGYVVERPDAVDIDPERVKTVARRDTLARPLPGELLALADWVSRYYCAPIGMTLAAMLPAAVKRSVGLVRRTFIDLVDPPPDDAPARSPQQRAVLAAVAALPDDERPIEIRILADRVGLKTVGPIKRLVERRHLQAVPRDVVEAGFAPVLNDAFTPDTLTAAQDRIVEAIAAATAQGFSAHLLYGVTGSGKTEVYIRLIERVLAAGRTAMLLVPEISLTPQTGGRLIGRFPEHRVAVLHSGLTAAQRHQQWALAAAGSADIVLGARSAVFAPVPDGRLGIVIVDESHDASYKQDQTPRYHGRDVAVKRAQLAECPVLLGSATPSLESWHNATRPGSAPYRLHRLDERVPGAELPRVDIVDFNEECRRRTDRGVHLLGPRLQEAIGRTLRTDGQVLLLLNRRGYANYIACTSRRCGWMLSCDHCDVTMVYHRNRDLPQGGYVRCHHCLTEQRLPTTCPDCGKRISTFGLGTQRVEEELVRKFPELVEGETMLRVDSDTMHRSRDFHDTLERFGRGDLRLLVGTQMIAKGLDYPGVRLVGVVNADTAVHLPDFRATERTFQLVSQVSGRTGRGIEPGRVIVQTFDPESPAILMAAAHDFPTFAARELAERRDCGLPPFTRMTRIVLRDEDHAKAMAAAKTVAHRLRALAAPPVEVRGPAPRPIARIAGRHRHQVEILAPTAQAMQALVTRARNEGVLRSDASMVVDVDPMALL